MKKSALIFISAFIAVLPLSATPKKLFFDNFKLPLKRTHWLKFSAEDNDWQKEFKVESSGLRWLVRTSGNPADITSFKVYNGSGKIIMQTTTLKRFDWVNFHGPFPYTIKVSGKAHTKPISIALDTHDNEDPKLPAWKSVQMLTWSLTNCTAAALPEGGAELSASEEKKGILRGYIYDRSSKKKYRASLTFAVDSPQQITFSVSWQGGKKSKQADISSDREQTVELEFTPAQPTVSLQLLFQGKIKLKKFYLWEVN